MRFGVLGPLLVGGETTVTAARDRTVLAMLLLHAGHPVPADELVDAVWGDQPPSTARGQLQSCVSRLRRVLVTAGFPTDVLTTDPAGYRIRVDPPVTLDSLSFQQLAGQARARLAADELAEAGAAFRSALALWRGPALAGISAPAVRRGAAVLDEQRLLAVEDRVEVELRLGQARELLIELTDLVDRNPLRERLRAHLMLALSVAGRQADALAVFRAGRDIVAGELGIEPGATLRDMHQRLLAGGATVDSGVAAICPVRCLPRAISDFTGRRETVARLVQEIEAVDPESSAVHVIDGMPGSGKTALAIHVATAVGGRYPDAHLFVDLRGHGVHEPLSPDAALVALLRQLGVPGERIPVDTEDRIARWRSELAGRRALLVLDNAGSTAQVTPLLPGGSGCLTLVTSRRRLTGLDGVRLRSLGVLEPGEAVDLLARVAGPDRVRAEPEAAAEVTRRCGYLPLAVRLAGARLAHRPRWRVSDLAERIGVQPVLAQFAAEHRTVADAFAWSYTQLSGPAQRMFRLISLHPGGHFDGYAVAAMTDLPLPAARELIDELLDAHLVEELDVGRYRLHELLHEYATGLLDAEDTEPDRRRALTALVDFFLHVTSRITAVMETPVRQDPGLGPPPRPGLVDACVTQGRDWLDRERSNLVAVVSRAVGQRLHDQGWRLARAAWRYLFLGGYLDDLVRTHTDGLTAALALGDDASVATMHNYLASAYFRQGEFHRAVASLEVVIEIRERLGDLAGQARSHMNVASPLYHLGRVRETWWHLERAVELAWRAGRPGNRSAALGTWAAFGMRYDRHDEALRLLWEKLFLDRQQGDLTQVATAIGDIGMVYARLGRYAPALRRMHLSLRFQRAVGNRFAEAELLNEIGVVERRRGRVDEAVARHRDALLAMRDAADRAGECTAYNGLGAALRECGDISGAIDAHERALRTATRIQQRYEQARALHGLALCRVDTDPRTAGSHWKRTLALLEQVESPDQEEVRRRLAELG